VTAAHRAYETLLTHFSTGWRAGPARVAASLGLFEPYARQIQQWRSGARPKVGPDARFRLAAVAERWRALLSQ
jgi:hypothetical protein